MTGPLDYVCWFVNIVLHAIIRGSVNKRRGLTRRTLRGGNIVTLYRHPNVHVAIICFFPLSIRSEEKVDKSMKSEIKENVNS